MADVMKKKRKVERAGDVEVPHVIDPRGVYTLAAARRALATAKNCLSREIRLGRLRATKRGGMYYLLGMWLLEWLEAGEIKRRAKGDRADVAAPQAAAG